MDQIYTECNVTMGDNSMDYSVQVVALLDIYTIVPWPCVLELTITCQILFVLKSKVLLQYQLLMMERN